MYTYLGHGKFGIHPRSQRAGDRLDEMLLLCAGIQPHTMEDTVQRNQLL